MRCSARSDEVLIRGQDHIRRRRGGRDLLHASDQEVVSFPVHYQPGFFVAVAPWRLFFYLTKGKRGLENVLSFQKNPFTSAGGLGMNSEPSKKSHLSSNVLKVCNYKGCSTKAFIHKPKTLNQAHGNAHFPQVCFVNKKNNSFQINKWSFFKSEPSFKVKDSLILIKDFDLIYKHPPYVSKTSLLWFFFFLMGGSYFLCAAERKQKNEK